MARRTGFRITFVAYGRRRFVEKRNAEIKLIPFNTEGE
jgi:hypothetical protein